MWLASHNPSCRNSAAIWDSPSSSATPHAGTDVDKAIAYGAALRADEMPRYLQHRHTLGQAQDLGIEVKVPLRPAILIAACPRWRWCSRLAVHMSQPQAIGIDDPIPTRDWLKSPWSGKTALQHAARISPAGAGGPLAMRRQPVMAPGILNGRLWRDMN
jgi:hypothetical protein